MFIMPNDASGFEPSLNTGTRRLIAHWLAPFFLRFSLLTSANHKYEVTGDYARNQ